eukprot:2829902-Prymnesium_polylepis.1
MVAYTSTIEKLARHELSRERSSVTCESNLAVDWLSLSAAGRRGVGVSNAEGATGSICTVDEVTSDVFCCLRSEGVGMFRGAEPRTVASREQRATKKSFAFGRAARG